MIQQNNRNEALEAEIAHLKAENEKLKKQHLQISRSFDRLSSLIANIRMGVLIESENRKIVDTNEYFCQLFGIPSPDIMRGFDCGEAAKSASELFEDPVAFQKNIAAILSKKQLVINEVLNLKDGRIFERDFVPVFHEQEFIGNMWIYRDITDRKTAETELKEREEHYRLLSENTTDGVALIENDKVKYVSEGYLKMLGYNQEEFRDVGLEKIYSYIHPEDRDKVVQSLQESLKNQEENVKYELRIKTKSGKYIWVEDKIFREFDEKGNRIRSVIHARDITERKTTELQLKKSEERFRKLIENMHEAVVLHNPDGAIIESNYKAEHILGLHEKDIKGQNSANFILRTIYENGEDYPGELHPAMLTIQKGEPVHDAIMGIIKSDESLTWIKINSEPVHFSDSKKPYALVTFSDITKLIEKEQRLSELNATKDKLFSIISHDLRNPCQAMVALSDLMMRNIKDGDHTHLDHQGQLMQKSARQSVELINNLLQWSRVQTGRIEYKEEKINIHELAFKILELSIANSYEKKLNISVDINKELTILADQFMIELILRNLISNAIKYTPEHGDIKLTANLTKKNTKISVHDSGIGIEKENIDKIFNVGHSYNRPGTANEKGTGLGLILSNEFAELHGGKISVKSEPGKGSTFTLIIPNV